MAAKKTAKKKKAKAKKVTPTRKITAVKKPMTKAEIVQEISVNAELNKKQVSLVLDEMAILIERHIKKRSPGKFTLPGLFTIDVKKKAATKARPGVNPQTGEKIIIKAKPARRVVKIRPLKKMNGMIV